MSFFSEQVDKDAELAEYLLDRIHAPIKGKRYLTPSAECIAVPPSCLSVSGDVLDGLDGFELEDLLCDDDDSLYGRLRKRPKTVTGHTSKRVHFDKPSECLRIVKDWAFYGNSLARTLVETALYEPESITAKEQWRDNLYTALTTTTGVWVNDRKESHTKMSLREASFLVAFLDSVMGGTSRQDYFDGPFCEAPTGDEVSREKCKYVPGCTHDVAEFLVKWPHGYGMTAWDRAIETPIPKTFELDRVWSYALERWHG